ncbi:unnamed protein product [Cylindrotheca closterium]|uniref:CCHC-type domain-containing protein n=1 Tax=Cylindrotheca closterium TaxID=2856 RepID=A0AAD2CU13_9STRA|nr:unnamed protein product [Cylindrotheca closterium]
MHRLRERAEKEEKRIKQIVGIANSAGRIRPNRSYFPGRPAPPRPGGRAFAGFHQPEFQGFQGFQDDCSFQAPEIETGGTFHTAIMPPPTLAAKQNVRVTDGQGRQLVVPTSDSKLYCPEAVVNMLSCMSIMEELGQQQEEENGWTMLSQAEEALQKASGKPYPIHCWGCKEEGHNFRDCPHKEDPQVLKRFYEKLDQWKQQKNEELNRNRNNNSHYRRGGYMTQAICDTVRAIEDPQTESGERTNLLVNLVKAVTAHTSTAAARKRPKRQSTQPALSFVTFGSFAAMEQAHQLNFSLNDILAF